MDAAKCQIEGSDYIGAFATSTDKTTFVAWNVKEITRKLVSKMLNTECIGISIGDTSLIGLLARANLNGIALANIATDEEVNIIKQNCVDINVERIKSDINAIGNNVLANDRIAIVHPEYSAADIRQIGDVLGVEVVKAQAGGFNTVGANNILTNKGLVINNRGTDEEKAELDRFTGFNSIRTTANRGGLSIGLGSITNSNGVLVGDETTGFELTRIIDALSTD